MANTENKKRDYDSLISVGLLKRLEEESEFMENDRVFMEPPFNLERALSQIKALGPVPEMGGDLVELAKEAGIELSLVAESTYTRHWAEKPLSDKNSEELDTPSDSEIGGDLVSLAERLGIDLTGEDEGE